MLLKTTNLALKQPKVTCANSGELTSQPTAGSSGSWQLCLFRLFDCDHHSIYLTLGAMIFVSFLPVVLVMVFDAVASETSHHVELYPKW